MEGRDLDQPGWFGIAPASGKNFGSGRPRCDGKMCVRLAPQLWLDYSKGEALGHVRLQGGPADLGRAETLVGFVLGKYKEVG